MSNKKFNTYMKRHLLKENIKTLLSPEDLDYYRAHRDEIEDILHAEWRHSKLSAKDAVEKHREGKLQQAKRGGGDETSLRAIAALNEETVVDINLMMGDDADKIPAQGKISFSEFVPLFDKYWRTTGAEGGDVDFISQGLENHVDAGMLTDEEADEAIDYFFEN